MWGDKETVVAGTLVGVDVTGWLIMDDYGHFHVTRGRASKHAIADGSHQIVFLGRYAIPFMCLSERSINIIKPITPPPPEVHEVTREVVREMTDEEVLGRALVIIDQKHGDSLSGTFQKDAWAASESTLYLAMELEKKSVVFATELPPPPAVTPPKVMKVEELKEYDWILTGHQRWFVREFKPNGDILLEADVTGDTAFRRLLHSSSVQELLDRGVCAYRDGEPISGWPIATLSPAETEGGE